MQRNNLISKIFNVTNKNIVITGSAGLLGSQYAETLSDAGANVILVDIDSKNNKKLEQRILKKYKTKAKSYIIDITKKTQVQQLRKEVSKDYSRIDALVNNAAYTTKASLKNKKTRHAYSFENFPLDLWEKSLAVNLTGTFLCSQEFGKIMKVQKKGVIINISSIYGIVGADQRIYSKTKLNLPVPYAAAKAAIINLTRYLAAYWHKYNIRVNSLSLGGVMDTTYQSKEFVKNYSNKTMMGRMANKNEFNGGLLFLISDASSYMTGSNLIIDGGWSAW